MFMHSTVTTVRYLLIIALATIVSGCVVTPVAYSPPTGDQVATLLFRSRTDEGVSYTVSIFADSQNCSGLQQIGDGSGSEHPEKISLKANQRAAFFVMFNMPNYRYCVLRPAFTPKTGQRYLMSIRNIPNGCQLGILNATDPDRVIRESSTVATDNTCNTLSSWSDSTGHNPDADKDFPSAKEKTPQLFNKPFDNDLRDLIQKDK